MFKTILSSISFSPSLVIKLSEYSVFIKNDLRVRRIGLVVLSFSIIIQSAILIFSPSQLITDNNETSNTISNSSLATTLHSSNLTSGFSDATQYIANANDIISITIDTHNNSEQKVMANISFNIKDLLEYADIIDIGAGSVENTSSNISWPSVAIDPDTSQTRNIVIRIKNSIPINATNGTSYDNYIQTKYEKSDLVIPIDKPIEKRLEQFLQSLPSVPMSLNLLVTSLALLLVFITYKRSEIIKKEIQIVRKDIVDGTI